MGLLDSVLGSALGAMTGQQGGGGGAGALIQVLGGLLANQGGGGGGGGLGGLGGLIGQLQQGGLADAVGSWISTGQNMPVSADQITAALGQGRLSEMAQQAGVPVGDLAGQLSQYLPQIIDKLSPNGQLPADNHPDLGGMLTSVLGGLLGGQR